MPDGYLSEDEGVDAEGKKIESATPAEGEPVLSEKSQERKKVLKEQAKVCMFTRHFHIS